MTNLTTKRMLRIAGWSVLAAALAFVGYRLYVNVWQIRDLVVSLGWTGAVGGILASFYWLGTLVIRSIPWGILLRGAARVHVGWSSVVSVHGRAQILKYLPGNVLHIAGRQVLGSQYGWSHRSIGVATIFETATNVAASLTVVVGLMLYLSDYTLLTRLGLSLPVLTAALVALLVAFMFWLPRLARRFVHPTFNIPNLGERLIALGLYILALLGAGILLWATVCQVQGSWQSSILGVSCASFAAAWLAGYITPGSPGGLGVREAVLVLALGSVVGESVAVSSALLMRGVTIIGDILYFALAFLLHKILILPRMERRV